MWNLFYLDCTLNKSTYRDFILRNAARQSVAVDAVNASKLA